MAQEGQHDLGDEGPLLRQLESSAQPETQLARQCACTQHHVEDFPALRAVRLERLIEHVLQADAANSVQAEKGHSLPNVDNRLAQTVEGRIYPRQHLGSDQRLAHDEITDFVRVCDLQEFWGHEFVKRRRRMWNPAQIHHKGLTALSRKVVPVDKSECCQVSRHNQTLCRRR